MDFFKRFGTDKHKFKVEFFLKTLICNAKLKGQISIKIKRGDHKVTSTKKVSLQQDGKCDFAKEILEFEALTLFYEAQKKAYQQKEVEISVIVLTKKGEKKLLGNFELDIAKFANTGKQNHTVSQKFGDKVKSVLEFDIFVKYIGEASQTSKQVQKQKQSKKQSSLSKFTSLFTASKQSPGKDTKQQKKEGNKNKTLDQKEINSSGKVSKEPQSQINNKKNNNRNSEQKDLKNSQVISYKKANLSKTIEPSKNIVKPGAKREGKQKEKNYEDQSEEDENEEETPKKQNKNFVQVKKKDNLTEAQSSADIKEKKKKSEEQIYFDEPPKVGKQKEEARPNRMKKTEKLVGERDSEKEKEKEKEKKISQFSAKTGEDIEKMQQNQKMIKKLKVDVSNLDKQNKQLKQENKKLASMNEKLSEKLQLLNKQNQERNFYQTQRENVNAIKSIQDERLSSLEKQKADLLVKLQKYDQKYKKDFQKYEQRVQQYQQQKLDQQESSKAEIKRLKDQFSQQKDKYDKLLGKYEEKVNEAKMFKQKENDLKEKLAIAQNSLSEIKLRIGDKLNEANQEGNKSVIDILTLLTQ